MSLKLKGLVLSVALIIISITTSVLTFTSNCAQVIPAIQNTTWTPNDVVEANKFMGSSLVIFSVISAMFERYINKKLAKAELENEELKTVLARSEGVGIRMPDVETPHVESIKTEVSEITEYPKAIK
jgi:hypothetical protein